MFTASFLKKFLADLTKIIYWPSPESHRKTFAMLPGPFKQLALEKIGKLLILARTSVTSNFLSWICHYDEYGEYCLALD